MTRVKGLRDLIRDAVDECTDLVEDMNESIAAKVMRVADVVEPLSGPAHLINDARRLTARGVYESIHGVNALVSHAGDLAQRALPLAAPTDIVPLRSDCMSEGAWVSDALIGAVNGTIGDHLHERGNSLDMGMQLRLDDDYVSAGDITAPRVALFLHGLSTTEWSWSINAEEYHGDAAQHFGRMLQADCGYTPVFLRYNTGRHISENGKLLAALLDQLQCTELVLIGHSMGGLVARSACLYGSRGGMAWVNALSHVICLGSPHLGAPLEKAGNVLGAVLRAVDIPATQVPARVLGARSAGIKDLRFGYLLDEDWRGRDPNDLLVDRSTQTELLDGVTYTFVAATITQDSNHPAGQLLGDIMVRTQSAHGQTDRTIATPTSDRVQRGDAPGVMHHEIQNHPDVYTQVRAALTAQAILAGESS